MLPLVAASAASPPATADQAAYPRTRPIRRTAGAIAAVVGLVLILPVLVQGLPSSWQTAITRYLPSTAGQAIIGRTKFTPPGHLLAPWTGLALFSVYTAVVLIAATITLNHRDA